MLLSSKLASPFLNLIRTLCKQSADTLIRRRNLWCLIWVCAVCISLEKMDASMPVLINNKCPCVCIRSPFLKNTHRTGLQFLMFFVSQIFFRVVLFFEWGPSKQQKVEESIEKLTTGTKRTKLNQLCRTRWVERHDAFEVFIDLPAIIETLEDYSQLPSTRKPGMPSASDLFNSISKFDFLATRIAVHKCLSYMKGLIKALQDSGLEIGKALDHISVVCDSLKDCRSDIDSFHSQLHEKACKLAEHFDVEMKVPRICERQTMQYNVPLADPNQYYRVAVTTKFLDHLLSEMTERFTDMHCKGAMSVKLIPGVMKDMPRLSDFEFF